MADFESGITGDGLTGVAITGYSRTRSITSISPAAATGTGVGVAPVDSETVLPLAAVGTGVGVQPGNSAGPNTTVSPAVAAGTGVGTGPLIALVVLPAASIGTGVGAAPLVVATVLPGAAAGVGIGSSNDASVVANPLAATGIGVGVGPLDADAVIPLPATGVGIGTQPGNSSGPNTTVSPQVALGIGAGTDPNANVGRTVHPFAGTGVGAGIGITVTVFAGPTPAAGVGIGNTPTANPTGTVTENALVLFETPHVADEPPWLDDSTQRQKMLMRHYANRVRGVNVWERSDGTFCVDTPCNYESAQTHLACGFSDDAVGPDETATEPGLIDTNINYPWNPFPGSTNSETPGSYAYITNWDGTTEDFVLNPYLAEWFPGGHILEVTQDQALALTAAGFGDCLS